MILRASQILRISRGHKYIIGEIIDGEIKPVKIETLKHTLVNCEALSEDGIEMWFNGAIYPITQSGKMGQIQISQTSKKPWCGYLSSSPNEQDFVHVNHIQGNIGTVKNCV